MITTAFSNSVIWEDSTKSWFVPKGTTGLTWPYRVSDYSININTRIRDEIIDIGIEAVAENHHDCHIIKTTFDFRYSGPLISPYTTHRHLWVRKYMENGDGWYLVIEK